MKKRLLLPLVLGLAAMGLFLTHQLGVLTVQAKTEETLILEVAIDGRTSVLNRVDPSATAPARGDTGIVNGYIFPEHHSSRRQWVRSGRARKGGRLSASPSAGLFLLSETPSRTTRYGISRQRAQSHKDSPHRFPEVPRSACDAGAPACLAGNW